MGGSPGVSRAGGSAFRAVPRAVRGGARVTPSTTAPRSGSPCAGLALGPPPGRVATVTQFSVGRARRRHLPSRAVTSRAPSAKCREVSRTGGGGRGRGRHCPGGLEREPGHGLGSGSPLRRPRSGQQSGGCRRGAAAAQELFGPRSGGFHGKAWGLPAPWPEVVRGRKHHCAVGGGHTSLGQPGFGGRGRGRVSQARGRSPRQRLRRGVHVTRNHTRWAARGHMTAACGHLLDGVRGRSRRAKPEGFSAPRGLCWDRSSGLGWPSACRRRPARETVSGRGPSRTMRATEDASAVRSAREVLWENLHFSGKLQTMLSSKGCKNVFFFFSIFLGPLNQV